MAAGAIFAVAVSAMRADPKNSITEPGRPFQVGLRIFVIDLQKRRNIERLHRASSLAKPINSQRVVLVVRDGKQLVVERDTGRSVTHTVINGSFRNWVFCGE